MRGAGQNLSNYEQILHQEDVNWSNRSNLTEGRKNVKSVRGSLYCIYRLSVHNKQCLERFWRISLYLANGTIAKLYVT